MLHLNRLRSSTLRYLRLIIVTLGLLGGNICLELFSNGYSFLFWLPLGLVSLLFLIYLPLLIKRELSLRPVEEQNFTPKQIYAVLGLVNLGAILYAIYSICISTDEEWNNYMVILLFLDICYLAYITPKVLKIIRKEK